MPPPALSVRRRDRARLAGWPRIVILTLLCSLLVPGGVELYLGTLKFSVFRLLLLSFGAVAAYRVAVGAITFRPNLLDMFMGLHVVTIAFSAVYHGGLSKGLEPASAVLVDMGLAYFVARAAVRTLAAYRYFARIMLIFAGLCGVFGLIETITGYSVILEAWHLLFPRVSGIYLESRRLSLYRATATFGTDILLGLFCTTAVALAVGVSPRALNLRVWQHRLLLALGALGVFSSLSSGPWLALILCFSCRVYDRLLVKVRNRWFLLCCAGVALFMAATFFTNRGPFKLVASYLTLSPQTGYVRMAMWESVWALMPSYWPLGWGWGENWPRAVDWYRWNSIDSYYAVLFVRSGVFSVLFIALFLISSWSRASRVTRRSLDATRETRAWLIGTICLFATAITVDLFGNLVFATYFLLGAGQVLLAGRLPHRHLGRPSIARPWTKRNA